jgi:hypothetical protein
MGNDRRTSGVGEDALLPAEGEGRGLACCWESRGGEHGRRRWRWGAFGVFSDCFHTDASLIGGPVVDC